MEIVRKDLCEQRLWRQRNRTSKQNYSIIQVFCIFLMVVLLFWGIFFLKEYSLFTHQCLGYQKLKQDFLHHILYSLWNQHIESTQTGTPIFFQIIICSYLTHRHHHHHLLHQHHHQWMLIAVL